MNNGALPVQMWWAPRGYLRFQARLLTRLLTRLIWLAMLVLAGCAPPPSESSLPQSTANPKIPIKVVVVSMFEAGAERGDDPGEFQHWVERMPLATAWEFPLGEYPLYSNDDGVLAICIGGGIANATASIMALGLDTRFDLSQAYWLIAGIAGGDPQDTSLGSAVWANHVVDGDLLYEIDGREIPKDWPYGLIPLGASEPAEDPGDIYTNWTLNTIHFALNQELAQWAYATTASIALPDHPEMRAYRALYEDFPNAQHPPRVMQGETLAASTYWHGERMNEWANDWVALYAGEQANFVTSNMEDSGTLTAIARLARDGYADARRVLVLRSVSNFTMPPSDKAAAWSTTAPYPAGGKPALESAFLVGREVISELVANWQAYRSTTPSSPIHEPTASE